MNATQTLMLLNKAINGEIGTKREIVDGELVFKHISSATLNTINRLFPKGDVATIRVCIIPHIMHTDIYVRVYEFREKSVYRWELEADDLEHTEVREEDKTSHAWIVVPREWMRSADILLRHITKAYLTSLALSA